MIPPNDWYPAAVAEQGLKYVWSVSQEPEYPNIEARPAFALFEYYFGCCPNTVAAFWKTHKLKVDNVLQFQHILQLLLYFESVKSGKIVLKEGELPNFHRFICRSAILFRPSIPHRRSKIAFALVTSQETGSHVVVPKLNLREVFFFLPSWKKVKSILFNEAQPFELGGVALVAHFDVFTKVTTDQKGKSRKEKLFCLNHACLVITPEQLDATNE